MQDINATIGHHVRIARIARGMTITELAKRVGCTQPHMSRLELGQETWSAARLVAASDAVRVAIDVLCPPWARAAVAPERAAS